MRSHGDRQIAIDRLASDERRASLGQPRVADGVHDRMRGSYLGPCNSDDDIARALDEVGAVYQRHDDEQSLIDSAARLLADAASLQAADRAYVESDGSFRALVTALFTSDSFLLRRSSTDSLASTAAEGTTE